LYIDGCKVTEFKCFKVLKETNTKIFKGVICLFKKKFPIVLLIILMIFSSMVFFQSTAKTAGVNGWAQSNGTWYYYQNGTMVKNSWAQDSNGWCYLSADGAWVTNNWVKDSNGWCYLNANGYWDGKPAVATIPTTTNGNIKISYIDVGQADSILIQQGNSSMLIDAGNNADSNTVKNYISQQGITQLDYVIGTHPHEDHIGGLDYVINSFKIGKIYMPKATSTTQTFQDVLTAIKNKGMQITTPIPGDSFKLGDATCTILGPINSNSSDLNTYSIVIKVTFGSKSFLFTGDAQTSNEQDMINAGYNLSADVLKVGHHGSNTSTSQAFLDKVNPTYAVISVGKDNDYGHPSSTVLSRLQSKGISIYRTDMNGTIVCTSDGNSINFNCNPVAIPTTSTVKTGWISSGGNWYYYNVNGTIATGWITLQGKQYYLNSNGILAVNTTTPDGYVVGSDGAWTGQIANTSSGQTQNNSETVYITKTGTKYHKAGCRYLNESQTAISKSDAISKGYTSCSVCKP